MVLVFVSEIWSRSICPLAELTTECLASRFKDRLSSTAEIVSTSFWFKRLRVLQRYLQLRDVVTGIGSYSSSLSNRVWSFSDSSTFWLISVFGPARFSASLINVFCNSKIFFFRLKNRLGYLLGLNVNIEAEQSLRIQAKVDQKRLGEQRHIRRNFVSNKREDQLNLVVPLILVYRLTKLCLIDFQDYF